MTWLLSRSSDPGYAAFASDKVGYIALTLLCAASSCSNLADHCLMPNSSLVYLNSLDKELQT